MKEQNRNQGVVRKILASAVVAVALAIISLVADVFGIIGFFSGNSSSSAGTPTVAATSTSQVTTSALPTSQAESSSETMTTTSTTSSLTVTTTSPKALAPWTYLSELQPLAGEVSTDVAFVNGQKLEFPVRLDPRKCGKYYAEYDLSGRGFVSLTAVTGLSSDYVDPDNRQWTFVVYGDGSPLFKQTMRLSEQRTVDVQLGGVNRLKVGVEWVNPGFLETCSPWNSHVAVYGDATLHR